MNERERRLQQRAQEREQQRRNRLISAGQNTLTTSTYASLPPVSVPIVSYQDDREEERAKRRDAMNSYNRKVAEERVKLQLSGTGSGHGLDDKVSRVNERI